MTKSWKNDYSSAKFLLHHSTRLKKLEFESGVKKISNRLKNCENRELARKKWNFVAIFIRVLRTKIFYGISKFSKYLVGFRIFTKIICILICHDTLTLISKIRTNSSFRRYRGITNFVMLHREFNYLFSQHQNILLFLCILRCS